MVHICLSFKPFSVQNFSCVHSVLGAIFHRERKLELPHCVLFRKSEVNRDFIFIIEIYLFSPLLYPARSIAILQSEAQELRLSFFVFSLEFCFYEFALNCRKKKILKFKETLSLNFNIFFCNVISSDFQF